jgi:hypothetical protein
MYKLFPTHPVYGEPTAISRISDGASIPFDPDNTDYQQYLEWLAEGNTPSSPDEAVSE